MAAAEVSCYRSFPDPENWRASFFRSKFSGKVFWCLNTKDNKTPAAFHHIARRWSDPAWPETSEALLTIAAGSSAPELTTTYYGLKIQTRSSVLLNNFLPSCLPWLFSCPSYSLGTGASGNQRYDWGHTRSWGKTRHRVPLQSLKNMGFVYLPWIQINTSAFAVLDKLQKGSILA